MTASYLLIMQLLVFASFPEPALAPGADLPRGEVTRVTTDSAAPYARLAVLASRSMHVLDLAQQVEDGILSEKDLMAVTITPADEAWEVLIPQTSRKNYGVLVWVSPTAGSSLLESWHEVLDRHGIIAISALDSGNYLPSLERRMPLALTGLHWASTRFPVDAERVYVGGFSGGSKIAQRLIFAYPDVFRGAILNAGFLEPGRPEVALPDELLYRHLIQRPFAFVTGRRDRLAIPPMRNALEAFEKYCLRPPLLVQRPQKTHQLVQADELAEALAHLEDPGTRQAKNGNACLDALVAEARQAIADLDAENADALKELDVRFGALVRSELLEHRKNLAK